MATIYDVARAAGVSPKTVSRVLNADGPVSKKTAEAVNDAIATLGYVPSSAARMMRSNRSGLIGLITGAISTAPEMSDAGGLPDLFIVQGIQRFMAQSGKTLMIADTGGQSHNVPQLIQTFLRHRVEGLIYVAEYHQRLTVPRLPDNTPMVLVNGFDDRGTPAILPDDRRGQRELVARLIATGHRRIGFLTLRATIEAGPLRLAGYSDALQSAGIAYDPALVQDCDLQGRAGEEQLLWDAIDRMLQLPEPPTVLCCGNDKMALRAYGILRSRDIRVPEQMSVAGYDNYRVIAETLYPPLTTVDLPYAAMGVRAAQRLLAMISGEGRDDHSATLVAGPVLWRGSVTDRRGLSASTLKLVRED
jgi:LacI family transcriptional regulator